MERPPRIAAILSSNLMRSVVTKMLRWNFFCLHCVETKKNPTVNAHSDGLEKVVSFRGIKQCSTMLEIFLRDRIPDSKIP